MKRYSHTECFEFFGVKPRNTRWSWSGRSEDGKDIAVTLWQDRFIAGGKTYSFEHDADWRSRPGFVELIENLAIARDNADGRVHVILAQPKDNDARPRAIARCFPQPNLKMRVVQLDEDQGTFTLERIDA